MLPHHLIRFLVAVPAVGAGLAMDVVVAPPWAFAGLVLFGAGVFKLLGAVSSWVGWLAYRAALRRRGVDPDDVPAPRPARAVNETLVFARPYTAGRAAVPAVSRRALCGCGLDPVSGRVSHVRRCRYAGAHRPDTVVFVVDRYDDTLDGDVVDAVVVS